MAVELRRLARNPALLLGVLGVVLLLGVSVFGALLAPYDPNAAESLIFHTLPDGSRTFEVPPTLPDERHVLGTDALGRDQWSRVLAGARLTLMIVFAGAVARLLIGVGFGLAAGWSRGPIARTTAIIATGVSAIPQLLLAVLLVLVTRPLGVAGFVLSLALVGWPELVEYVASEVRSVRDRPFIVAARALGIPGSRVVGRHVVAAIAPQLLTVAALEAGAVLLLLAELGIVGLFLAGATFIVGEFGYIGTMKDRAPEWGQMLGAIQFFAMGEQLSTLFPAVFIVLASVVFTLLADGLRAASDPFGERGVLPRMFGVIGKALAATVCVSAVGLLATNVQASPLTMDEGRAFAAETAAVTWPGSEYVAGVARYSSAAHGMARPERLTYYFRNDRNEVLRISYADGDRLAADVRPYETEDEIDFKGLRALPSGLMSYDEPVAKADAQVGESFRQLNRGYLVRAVLSWPADRDAPVYEIKYGLTTGQVAIRRACCFDAKTGEAVDSLVTTRVPPPWPVPASCAVSRTVLQQLSPGPGPTAYLVIGSPLSAGSLQNLYFQGDNFMAFLGGQGIPALDRATLAGNEAAEALIVNAQPSFGAQSFATLRLEEPGCWTLRVSSGGAALDLKIYAYPWECRPAQQLAFPPPQGVTPRKCVAP